MQICTRYSRSISVNIFLDNSTAVTYINKCGGTRSKSLFSLATDIGHWCEDRDIAIMASHLSGSLNFVADEESRSSLDSSDWMLLADEFKKLQKIWSMDIAAAWNRQLPKFVSWLPQPKALAVNALSLSWRGIRGYAFPRFVLSIR